MAIPISNLSLISFTQGSHCVSPFIILELVKETSISIRRWEMVGQNNKTTYKAYKGYQILLIKKKTSDSVSSVDIIPSITSIYPR